MAKRKVGNLLGLAVLSYLMQRPMHPYELQRMLRDNDAARTFKLSYGALYAVVGQLQKAGFIEAVETVRDGNLPERTVYRLTDTGRQEAHDWLRQLVAEPQRDYPAFAAALSLLAVLSPDEARPLLARRVQALAEERAAVRQTIDETVAGGVSPLFLVEDEYRLAIIDAEVDFINRLTDEIDRPGGWAAGWAAYHQGRSAPEQEKS